jgi:hypothetical protein
MPLTNLCNRLVVNEHPLDPTLLEPLTLIRLTAPSMAAFCQHARDWHRAAENRGRRRIACEGIFGLE